MSNNEFEDEDLENENEDLEEDEALSQQLDQENLEKFIRSFDTYLSNPNGKEEQYLLTDNLVIFLDNMPKVRNYYDGFKELLTKISDKIDQAREQTKDTTILALLNESLQLIKKYLGSSYNEYKQKYYEKYPKEPKDKTKELAELYAKQIMNRNIVPLSDDLGLAIARDISDTHEGRKPISEIEKNDPEVTKALDKALARFVEQKNEYQQRLNEARELSNQKIELSDKSKELERIRKQLLGACIDNLIKGN